MDSKCSCQATRKARNAEFVSKPLPDSCLCWYLHLRLSVVPAVILIHFGVLVRIPSNSESEQVREAADHRKSVLEWCFGKSFRAAACP